MLRAAVASVVRPWVTTRRQFSWCLQFGLAMGLVLTACAGDRDEQLDGSVHDGGADGDGADEDTSGGASGEDGDGDGDTGDPTDDGGGDSAGEGSEGPTDDTGDTGDTGGGGAVLDPPAGESSGGSGGGVASGDVRTTATGGITYRVIAPSGNGPWPLLVVYSGTEGGAGMTQNLSYEPKNKVYAVLDGVDYRGDGQAGAYVLDDVRSLWDIDNDRTYLLGESAGTTAALALGFDVRQSYFAAYWANDVNASGAPSQTAAQLGFAPFGNAGPGGDFADANAIVSAMQAAGYRTPPPAPYDGPGAGSHGDVAQFDAALAWFGGKSRQ